MASGSSSRRPESRLLDSAVRDAVGQVGVSSSGGNPSRRTESGLKRLRSVVVGSSGNPDLPSEENGQYQHLKPRLDMGLQGSKIPPGVAVALKAAAAAAEDVNNNSMKNRMRSSGSVWDRLGNKSSERLGIKENGAHEAARVNADDGEEDTWEGTKEAKRPRWRTISERLGPREEEGIAMASDVNPGGFGHGGQGKRVIENEWYDTVGMGMKLSGEEVSDGDDRFGDAANYTDGGFFRYRTMHKPYSDGSEKFQDPSGSLFYRLGDRAAQSLPHGFISGLSGAANLPNKIPNIHINSNARYLLSNDALSGHHNFYSQLSKHGAALEKPSQAVVDANDVLEMKKRMRQVQLEMTKLRAKQAEVSKEAQKAGSAPPAVKVRSQEEIDLHSVCVTNIHFAATKEMIAAHFSSCGDIIRVTVLVDTATGKPRGSAYVEFSSKDDVEKALNMNDSSLLSRTLKVTRKDAALESVVPPTVARPTSVHYASLRSPGKFMRGHPLRRPLSMRRPFAGTANLQWKRETSSPADKTTTPNFGNTNGSSIPSTGRISALRRDRYGHGPVRMARSLSYVRPAPYPSRETTQPAAKKT